MGALNDLCSLYSLLCYRGDTIIGSGSIVRYNEKFYLLTCCHNFLETNNAWELEELEDDDMKRKIKKNCKKVQYHFSTKDFKSTVALPAAVVLKDCINPKLECDKVGTVAFSIEL